MTGGHDIEIEFDSEIREYYIIWKPPVIIGCGKTREKAINDAKKVARFTIDTLCTLKEPVDTKR